MNLLKKMGVEKELVRQGVGPGDTVKVSHFEFFYELDDEGAQSQMPKKDIDQVTLRDSGEQLRGAAIGTHD